MTKTFFDVKGKYFLKESDEQKNTVRLSQSSKEWVKDGMSACYEITQTGEMVPVMIRFYKNGVDCGISYGFDCMTKGFTQLVENTDGRVCVSMDRFSIKKYKNIADAYYKQAQNMWNIICTSNKRIYVR